MPRQNGFNHFPAVIRSLNPLVEDFVEKIVVDIAAGAAATAPVDTGALAASYHGTSEGLQGQAGSNIEYAPYVEYGTRHNRAQPHLVPSVERVTRSIDPHAKVLAVQIEKSAK